MPGSPATAQMRAVCITVWPPPKECLYDMLLLDDKLQYVYVGGEETCPETGNKHKHIYAYAKNRGLRLNGWKKIFGKQCHVEQARGTHAQAIAYCCKEVPGEEFGEKPMENGIRKGFAEALELVKSGERVMKIARTADSEVVKPLAQYNRFFEKMEKEIGWEKMCEEGFIEKQVYILEGATGKGKTKSVHDEHGYLDVWKPDNSKGQWFDGYTGQSVVIFDECGPGNIMSVTQFLNITDGYPLSVPVKGSFVNFRPKYIYFTTNIQWERWWDNINQEHLAACRRRITEVRVFKQNGTVEYR